jgi:DNA repair protein RecO
VLDYREFGEFDHLLVVFSKDFGKQEILLKGSKKNASKLKFCLQKFVVMEYEVVKAKTFDRLIFSKTRFYLEHNDMDEGESMKLYSLYNVLSEMLLKQLHFDQEEPEIYEEFVALLEGKRINDKNLLVLYFNFFVLRLFYVFGLGVNLNHCVISGNKKSHRFFLSFRHGGLVEESYVEEGDDYLPMDTATIIILRAMQQGYWENMLKIFYQLPFAKQEKILNIGFIYLNYYDVKLKAFRFFEKMLYN